MKSIQSKILFVVITALIVITALVTAIAVNINHEIMHKDADQILTNASQKEAALINDMLNDFRRSSSIMKHYAKTVLRNAYDLKDPNYLAHFKTNISNMFDEVALNTSGTNSYYLCMNPELTGSNTGFYKRFDSNGSLYELNEKEFAALSLFETDEFKTFTSSPIAANDLWLQPHPSRFTGENVISYLAPIYSNGVLVGLVGFNMDFNYLIERINNISVYQHGYALLMDPDNVTCYNPTEASELEGEYTMADASLINGMRLELRASYQDIQSETRPLLINIIVCFLCVFAGALVYTIWVTHHIVTPLKKLTVAAQSISSGKQENITIIDSKDEIGLLSRVFNETYGKIMEYSSYIKALAYRDSLTGIKNSTAYTEAIEELNKEINLASPTFGVIVADINNLKKTNDNYGHDIGNELIVHCSRILTETFKTSSVYRIGGDEFVVILKGGDLDNYRTLIERMDSAFAADYISVQDQTLPVSMARGVALYDPTIDHVYADVFTKADHAMYLNKEDMKASLM